MLRFLNNFLFFPIRVNRLVSLLEPYLFKDQNILDVGGGDGVLGKILEKKTGAKIKSIDKLVQGGTLVKQHDGKNLPYRSSSFDGVMMVDMLHHDKNPERVLQEAKRVTKRFVFIKDHYFENKLDWWLLKFADYIGNKPYGIDLPYNFFSKKQWGKIIKSLGLRIEKSTYFRDICLGIMFKQVIFILRKDG